MRLHDCLTRAARISPTSLATFHEDRARTWREVHDAVARLAAALRSLGISPGDRLAVLAANSDRYFDVFFAASWTAAVLVPLNTRLTEPELVACLRDSGATVLLAGNGDADRADRIAAGAPQLHHVLRLGKPTGASSGLMYEHLIGAHEPCPPADGDGRLPAGIFYTGGTTGQPKGVVLSHDNLMANAWHMLPALGWDRSTVFLHAGPMFHLADICCLVAVSAVAGRHIILPGFAPETVTGAVEAHGVTALGLVPTMINALVSSPAATQGAMSSLTSLLYGGSPMPGELITRTLKTLPNAQLWQAYGQTEAGPILTLLPPQDHLPGPGSKAASAGLPVLGCEIAITDPDTGGALPAGKAGEICGRGDNVMSRYWNQPGRTAATLQKGWLHTGDIGHLDGDGYLYVTGRLTEMIITGGENVYPAEVEDVLYQYPGIAEVAVIGIPDGHWGQRVHAVIAARPGEAPSTSDLITFCRERLAGYKCPRSIEIRGSLPKTGAGKIDKKLLATPH